jgi:YggT family protein
MTQALYFIVKTLAQLFLMVVLLRFWLPWLRVDFRNPVSQGILRITSPLIVPIRRFLPSIGRLDTATVVVVFILQYLLVLLLLALTGRMADPFTMALLSLLELAIISLNLFFFAILIMVVLSWVAPHTYNPVSAFVAGIAEPVLRPFRRLIPSIGGLDISPIFAIVLLKAGEIFLQTLKPFPF